MWVLFDKPMIGDYEIYRAAIWPVPTVFGLLWEIRFQKKCKWKNGPACRRPNDAFLKNFELNKMAPGFMEQLGSETGMMHSNDKLL